jgi:hypothetical protein
VPDMEITRYRALVITAAELLVNVGIMQSVADQWPLVVQENWEERLDSLILKLQHEMEEIQGFAEAFDDPE